MKTFSYLVLVNRSPSSASTGLKQGTYYPPFFSPFLAEGLRKLKERHRDTVSGFVVGRGGLVVTH